MYIDGKWVKAVSNESFPVINPANGQQIGSVPKGGAEDAKLAVDAAEKAFQTWSKMTADQRGHLLRRWYETILDNKQEIAETLVLEQGKPMKEALGEITYAASFVYWYAEEGKRVYGETIPASHPDKRILVLKQPVGVVAAITPWNFPAAMITRKVAPALAAGCTVVIKPAEQTPLTALKLAEAAELAGIPKGVVNVVTGEPAEIGDQLLKDSRVRKVTFTGSTEVGKHLMRKAADTVKKISLELGGHAPFIIFADANLDLAVQGVLQSKFRNSGQTCICTNRVYVEKSIASQFIEKLRDASEKLTVGYGLEPETEIGPLIDEDAYKKVESHIQDAVQKGGKIESGGKRLTEFEGGYFVKPTIISGATEDMKIMQEETFGPVAPVMEFEELEEVVKRANNTPYGLAAYAYTENLKTAVSIAEQLEYGIVGINDALPSVVQAPFGGFKESGIGREGGHFGIDEFLEIKYVSLKI
ncbi:NAD-dependent succinate-semialdehyde dehydrogenase [Fervidibacillus halotolerans]|uniref:Aldehyde dehydrogenase n=1 Tax=Fervidibacillus halotolerans TaxID=2980027 RepID=A0A9E8S049_9BACI|nr:NAD-dependent succinate-semialdehyde dehydrogenase [Fervidibacillus halotolerans]WAA13844.1 NAD-dependent succinate-semialdehyde dehydrogenase [Fervidibacillus halotolerans]